MQAEPGYCVKSVCSHERCEPLCVEKWSYRQIIKLEEWQERKTMRIGGKYRRKSLNGASERLKQQHLAPLCSLQQAPETKAAFRITLVAPACTVLDPTLASPSRSVFGCLIIDAYVLLILVFWCPWWTLQRGGWRYLSNSESRGPIPHPVHTQRQAIPADMTSALQPTEHI